MTIAEILHQYKSYNPTAGVLEQGSRQKGEKPFCGIRIKPWRLCFRTHVVPTRPSVARTAVARLHHRPCCPLQPSPSLPFGVCLHVPSFVLSLPSRRRSPKRRKTLIYLHEVECVCLVWRARRVGTRLERRCAYVVRSPYAQNTAKKQTKGSVALAGCDGDYYYRRFISRNLEKHR